ncbi:hypothetical protein K402DRAFT_341208 [Aulographum hederae CBS 113979]|uniref:Ubiquitination network signaling protein n=1 Tax=Aulographum hederae CBS 113979 TaxID=1176131 RepID=A0A6G1GM70_9PEZI|nr:hypothetical protein K402DRAFT_341208 [Aulographum hederae CBS 113979]
MPPKTARRANDNSSLAALGKRISKKKSNSALNSNHATRTTCTSSPPASNLACGSSSEGSTIANGKPLDAIMGESSCAPACGRDATLSEAPFDKSDAFHLGNGSLAHPDPASPLKVDNNSGGIKSSTAFFGNKLALATTILKSCPLRDVIAMLILLLQLPPTVLTIIQFLFATMTYVPRPATSTWSALPSLNDCFQGTGGSPSVATIMVTDGIVLLLWLLLWTPVQNIALDFAQAVIAISFSGAAAGRTRTWTSPIICVAIILLFDTFRYKLLPSLSRFNLSDLPILSDLAASSSPSEAGPSPALHAPQSWMRSLLGVHILTQGIVRIIRRSLHRRDTPQLPKNHRKTDPEAATAVQGPRNSVSVPDQNTDATSTSSTDGRPPGPSPAPRDSKEKMSSGRKRRKQATQVRSQQPVWAALAHTKVTVSNSMEQTQISSDALEANAFDINHVGNANFKQDEDRVWISELGATDVAFGVCISDVVDEEAEEEVDGEREIAAGIDKTKPFYVRINGADWSSTRIREAPQGSSSGHTMALWTGEIFGLTPLSNYHCEFVRVATDTVFHSASLITESAPYTEQTVTVLAPAHQSLRPSSPTTTLRNSIASVEQQLQERRNRLKQKRKEHKNGAHQIKREVDILTGKLSSSGGTDDRQRQRTLQLKQTIRQAEEAARDAETEAAELGDIPEAELQDFEMKQRQWAKQKGIQSEFHGELEAFKDEYNREMGRAQADISNATQKRDRLQLRQLKLAEQHERLVVAHAQDQFAQTRRLSERAAESAKLAAQEQTYSNQATMYEAQTQNLNGKAMQYYQQSQHLEALMYQQQQIQQGMPPTTPEGELPGTRSNRNSQTFSPAFQFPLPHGPFGDINRYSAPSLHGHGRDRSSSMHSGISHFTDDAIDGNNHIHNGIHPSPLASAPGYPVDHLNGRKGSNGSGSASISGSSRGSGNGSLRDPMSPPPNPKVLSPVGTPLSAGGYR